MLELLFTKFTSHQACNFIKKRLQHRCFPVKFLKVLRARYFTEHLQWLILDIVILLNIFWQIFEILKIKFYEQFGTTSSSFQLFF